MAILQFSETLRNNRLNQFESTLGGAARLRIFSGTKPASVADPETGALLCEIVLPSDWMTAAVAGSKTKAGTWTGFADLVAGDGTTAGYFRMRSSSAVAHCQGDITATGGGGAMTLNDTLLVAGQPVTVTMFTLTEGNV
jgi:hypothetical protein